MTYGVGQMTHGVGQMTRLVSFTNFGINRNFRLKVQTFHSDAIIMTSFYHIIARRPTTITFMYNIHANLPYWHSTY